MPYRAPRFVPASLAVLSVPLLPVLSGLSVLGFGLAASPPARAQSTSAQVFSALGGSQMANGTTFASAGVSKADARASASVGFEFVQAQAYGEILASSERSRFETAASGGSASWGDRITVSSLTLPQGTPVSLTFVIGYYSGTGGYWGQSNNNAAASTSHFFSITPSSGGGAGFSQRYENSSPTFPIYQSLGRNVSFSREVTVNTRVGDSVNFDMNAAASGNATNNKGLSAGQVDDDFINPNYYNSAAYSWIRYNGQLMPSGVQLTSQSGFDYSAPPPAIVTAPEPGSFALFGVSLAGCGAAAARRRRKTDRSIGV